MRGRRRILLAMPCGQNRFLWLRVQVVVRLLWPEPIMGCGGSGGSCSMNCGLAISVGLLELHLWVIWGLFQQRLMDKAVLKGFT